MSASQKRSLRQIFRAARRALSEDSQRCHALAVANEVATRLANDETVAGYLARDGEVDLSSLFERCWQREIVVAVPVLQGPEMRFARYRRDESLRPNQFGIAEPADPAFVTPNVVLAPLVAFDRRGRRLGMGGGYYDRYFAATPTPVRIGIAHECQRASELPATASDVPLTAVVTENGWQSF